MHSRRCGGDECRGQPAHLADPVPSRRRGPSRPRPCPLRSSVRGFICGRDWTASRSSTWPRRRHEEVTIRAGRGRETQLSRSASFGRVESTRGPGRGPWARTRPSSTKPRPVAERAAELDVDDVPAARGTACRRRALAPCRCRGAGSCGILRFTWFKPCFSGISITTGYNDEEMVEETWWRNWT